MAKIYGNTTSAPAEAPAGLSGDGLNPVELTNGATLPVNKTFTATGDVEVNGELTTNGASKHQNVTFLRTNSSSKLDFFASNVHNPTVSGFSATPTTQVAYTRCGPMVTWTVSGIAGSSDATGTDIVINTGGVIPSAVWPDVSVNTLITVTDSTDVKVGNAELKTDGQIVIRLIDGPFTATAGQNKSLKTFSINFVNTSEASAANLS